MDISSTLLSHCPKSEMWRMLAQAQGEIPCEYHINSLLNVTSVWLELLHSQLFDSSNPLQQFDGFDVSSSLFPKKGKCKYMVQNMLNPFPDEYHGLYDLVHVRYTVVEFMKEHYVSAVDNLMKLLSEWTIIPITQK